MPRSVRACAITDQLDFLPPNPWTSSTGRGWRRKRPTAMGRLTASTTNWCPGANVGDSVSRDVRARPRSLFLGLRDLKAAPREEEHRDGGRKSPDDRRDADVDETASLG